MNIKLKIIVILGLTFLWFNCASAGQHANLSIKALDMGWSGEGVYVTVNESVTPESPCTGTRFVMTSDTLLFRENMSVLLSAFHAGSKVGLFVNGCWGTDMRLKAVSTYK